MARAAKRNQVEWMVDRLNCPIYHMMYVELDGFVLPDVAHRASVPVSALDEYSDRAPSLASETVSSAFPARALVSSSTVHGIVTAFSLFEPFKSLFAQLVGPTEVGMVPYILVVARHVAEDAFRVRSLSSIRPSAVWATDDDAIQPCLCRDVRAESDAALSRAKLAMERIVPAAWFSRLLSALCADKRDYSAVGAEFCVAAALPSKGSSAEFTAMFHGPYVTTGCKNVKLPA